MKGKAGGKRRWKWIAAGGFVLFLAAAIFFQPLAHVIWEDGTAGCEKKELRAILSHGELGEEEYQMLFEQTGLTKKAVDAIGKNGADLLKTLTSFQDAYLGKYQTECDSSSMFTKEDRIRNGCGKTVPLAPLEEGDIFLSFSSHSLGWRHGHAGLVVDEEEMLTLEAVMPGRESEVKELKYWKNCSNFLVLRLKGVPRQERRRIARYARENLAHIPYGLTSGVFGKRDKPQSAQCAYLIWYAFFHFGYDLDSDGGRLVTVMDLAQSPKLELIQVFGLTTEKMKEFEIV